MDMRERVSVTTADMIKTLRVVQVIPLHNVEHQHHPLSISTPCAVTSTAHPPGSHHTQRVGAGRWRPSDGWPPCAATRRR